MALQEIADAVEDSAKKGRDRWIAVYIGVLAVLLAVAGVGSGNAMKDAMARNIEASNTWAFFQAKNIRRHELRLQVAEFEAMLAVQPDMPAAARSMITEKIATYRQDDQHLTSDPARGEGLDELFVKGKQLEEERDVAMQRDPFFDYGQALLQIAIVLASVAIIAGGSSLLVLSGVIAVLGAAATLNGFLLFWVPAFL
ncbi:DUF4337 domain-containing protein [Hyphomicrobium sulfonivorans]|uniref:DUF4337 domain-containing protein n=1 Tax=Hyphomicrobium sulfonivorans TaxID=121290 RepID=UPI00156DD135|nr:DUF4337 domain-containing protein [Hyphomicrobium sulfonivorans]MBI1648532.1 DUF4337 domain-containing protein [Hyphomicrobium sulfonivorans]NSL70930.1 DUF4337 domain-containing protein [Hyphomicrobium sulfonivorans]